ncbi:MAG: undecaprenyl-diphosphate phosphatase [Flavobacteriales bacterium]|nr:undecaprenyl-diphosphate phosphatase [Flavobacteriales bacterium]
MSHLEAILIGIIQGLTEFLPVSSSGHIELSKAIFGTELEEGLLFTVVLHAATALSTVVVFRKDLLQIIRGLFQFKWNEETRFSLFVVISMIPAAIVGLTLEEQIEKLFDKNVLLVGCMLLLTGLILFISDRIEKSKTDAVSTPIAIVMGLVQAIAILPGISRSGSTIATGVLMGFNRSKAARFSFIMVLPLIAGAALKKFMDYMEADTASTGLAVDVMSLGFIAAFLSGVIAIRWMIKLVERSQLKWFAVYCLLAGVASIAWSLSS